MIKRLGGVMLGGALALLMVMCLVCVPASAGAAVAAEVSTDGGASWTGYATFGEAWGAAEGAGIHGIHAIVRLLEDVGQGDIAPYDWPLSVPSTMDVTLDLNGRKLDRELTEVVGGAGRSGNVIQVYGKFTLADDSAGGNGKITGGYNRHEGGGVSVYDGGTFVMNGGEISGNRAEYGGGVYMDTNGGSFVMTGGAISGNTADVGGGVDISNSMFNMSGGTISGNSATINGGGACMYNSTFNMSGGAISGNGADDGGGLFIVYSTFNMSGGLISGNAAATNGGGVDMAHVTFNMSGGAISGNAAAYTGGGAYVYNATITMTGGEISGNAANYSGGVEMNDSDFTMNGGAISDNTANYGGGVRMAASSSTFTMNGGTISGNKVTGVCGGVYVGSGVFTMNGGEISGNEANTTGGVFINIGATFAMSGGRITGNHASDSYGGVFIHGGATIRLSGKPVISGNTASGGASNLYLNENTSGGSSVTATVTLTGALQAGASVGVTRVPAPSGGSAVPITGEDNAEASWTSFYSDSASYGVYYENNKVVLREKDASVAAVVSQRGTASVPYSAFAAAWSDAIGRTSSQTDPVTVTLYRDVDAGSSSINVPAGKHIILNAGGYTTDRTQGKNVDDFSVITIHGSLTLTGGGVITGGISDPDRSRCCSVRVYQGGAFVMESGEISGGKPASGNGVYVDGGTFTMNGGSICNNQYDPSRYRIGGVFVTNGGTFTMNGGAIYGNASNEEAGGVIVYTNGTFTMTGGTITDNTAAYYGGGVAVYGSGAFVMDDGTISGNFAKYMGGGVFVNDGGTFKMNGGAISGNATDSSGGGVRVTDGAFTMTGGRIAGNSASAGGGVNLNGASTAMSMSGGEISGNTAKTGGGGVLLENGASFDMLGGSIIENKADASGGGVYAVTNSSFAMSGGSITGNTARSGGGAYVNNATITMTGGRIAGNTADNNGGGVFYGGGAIKLSGDPVISGNTVSGAANNLYLASGRTVTIDTGGLTSGASIGVWSQSTPAASAPVPVTGSNGADYRPYFSSDVSAYHVVNTGAGSAQVVQLAVSPLTITYKDEGDEAYTGGNLQDLPKQHVIGTATALIDGVKANHTFGGWFTTSDGSGAAVTELSAYGYAADITLYAKWGEIPVISFDAQPAASTTVTVGRITEELSVVVSVTSGGTATLNWYACDAGGAISGPSLGTGSTFAIPPSLVIGTHYFLCQAAFAGAATVNSDVAEVIVNREPIMPLSSENRIDGVAPGQVYAQGEIVTFTAVGGGSDNDDPITGDQMFTGMDWRVNPAGDFDDGNTQRFPTASMVTGEHTLTVRFKMQRYDGANWADIIPLETDEKSVRFRLRAAPVPPKTGDSGMPLVWLGACAVGMAGVIGIALSARKRRRAS